MPVGFDPSQWAVVSRGIYFVPADVPKSGRSFAYATRIAAPKSVWYFDFATKQVREVFEAEKALNTGLSVSPDGRWILYTQEGEDNSDIMLVDHFD
jgi:Tol biopolymer transport system component